MNSKIWIGGSLLVIFVAGSLGCGKAFRAFNSSKEVSATSKMDVSGQVLKAQEASKEAQLAINEANALIQQITDDKGNINIGLFNKATTSAVPGVVQAQGLLAPLTAKLREVFDKVFAGSLLFPVALAGLGIGIVFIGVRWQRNEARLHAALLGLLPVPVRALVERAHG